MEPNTTARDNPNTLNSMLLITSSPVPYLGHDLWVWVLDGISPLHSDHISPHFHLAAHQPAAGLSCRLVVFIFQEAKASIFLLVVWLVVQYDII